MNYKTNYNKDFTKFKNEVLEYTCNVHQQFTKHNLFLLLLYGLGLGIINTENKVIVCGICYLISGISLVTYLLFKYYFLKNKKHVIFICNIYLFLFIGLLRLLYFWHPSQIANTLLVCSMVTTTLTNFFPKLYNCILITITIIHMLFHFFVLPYDNMGQVIAYLLNDILIIVFASGVNRLFVRMKYDEFKRAKHLRNESFRDPLTNLYNRRYVERYIDLQLEEGDNCTFMLIDLDNFKNVNDNLGHEVGDEILCQVSNILKHSFRKSDCVARIGGDEFLVIMPSILEEKYVNNKISGILNKFPIMAHRNGIEDQIPVSVSIGVVFSNVEKYNDYEELYRRADEYMYKAKNSGKGVAVIENLYKTEDMVIFGK